MAKRSKAPTNLGQGIPRVGGELVDRLNKLDEGLGTALAYELNHRFSLADVRSRAAAGHAGTVVIAEQPRDSVGNKAAAIDVSGGNVAGSGWATQGDHLTPLSQVRSLFTCDHFGGHPSGFPGWFEECVQAERRQGAEPTDEPPPEGIIPWFWGYTVYPPAAADTFADEGGTSGSIHFMPFSLQEAAKVSQVVFNLATFNGTIVSDAKVIFGLYDVNYDLVCDTGAVNINDPSTGRYFVGPRVANLRQGTITIPAGGYFFAFACTVCMHIWMSHWNMPAISIWNKGTLGAFGGPIVSGWVGLADHPINQRWFETGVLPPHIGVSQFNLFAANQGVPLALFCIDDLDNL